MAATETARRRPRPVKLNDHIPEILVVELAVLFTVLAALQFAFEMKWPWPPAGEQRQHTIFWLGAICSLLWAVSYRWNLSKKNFLIVVGLFGTFVGIPAAIEIVGKFTPDALGWFAPFTSIGRGLGVARGQRGRLCLPGPGVLDYLGSGIHLEPAASAGQAGRSGAAHHRADGKRKRYDLIGLKTEEDPFDYSERALLGIGSLSLRTRAGKPIFSMKRVIGLYRIPLLFWVRPKLQRIEEVLNYHGMAASGFDRLEMPEAMEETDGDRSGNQQDGQNGDFSDDDVHGGEFDAAERRGEDEPRADVS